VSVLFSHPLVKLARSIQRLGTKAANLPLQMRSVRLDINFALAAFDAGPKTEATFRKLECVVEKEKLRLEEIRLKIDFARSQIETAHSVLLDFKNPSPSERELILDLELSFPSLVSELSNWSDEIDDALEEVDTILASFALEVRS
jgi:hypothetical protein